MPKFINPVPRFNYHTPKKASSTIVVKFSYSFQGQNKRLTYSPGIKIEKKFWDFKSQRPKPHPSDNQKRIRSDLNRLEGIILEVHNKSQGRLSIQEFKKELDYRFKGTPRPEEATRLTGFLQFFQFFLDQQAEKLKTGELTESTLKKYRSIYSKLEKYCQETGQELTLEAINSDFRQSFVEWCFDFEQNQNNTVAKYLSLIAQVISEARAKGLTENRFPESKEWKLKKAPTSHIALSESELEAINNLDLKACPEGYQKARQLFLIGAYSGLRFSDYKRITPNMIEEISGTLVIKLIAKKTQKLTIVPISSKLKAILEECKYQAPDLSEQKLNEYIKEIGRLAGINQGVTKTEFRGKEIKEIHLPKHQLIASHTARRTFITLEKEKGMPNKYIMEITGHSSEGQINLYDKKSTLEAMLEYLNQDKK